MDYYELLGVTYSDSADAIRRAYRRLALKYHPDKNPGQEAAHRWNAISEAYKVLSDERRRPVYDAVGREGLRFYDMAGGLGRAAPAFSAEDAILPPVLLINVWTASLGSLLLLISTFAAVVSWQLEGRTSLPWPVAFLPLWLADPLFILIAGLAFSEGRSTLRPTLQRQAPTACLLIAFQVLLCARLQTPSAFSWLAVFTPLLISRGTAMAALPSRVLDLRRHASAHRSTPGPFETATVTAVYGSARLLLESTQLALMPAALEGTLRLSWCADVFPSGLWRYPTTSLPANPSSPRVLLSCRALPLPTLPHPFLLYPPPHARSFAHPRRSFAVLSSS